MKKKASIFETYASKPIKNIKTPIRNYFDGDEDPETVVAEDDEVLTPDCELVKYAKYITFILAAMLVVKIWCVIKCKH